MSKIKKYPYLLLIGFIIPCLVVYRHSHFDFDDFLAFVACINLIYYACFIINTKFNPIQSKKQCVFNIFFNSVSAIDFLISLFLIQLFFWLTFSQYLSILYIVSVFFSFIFQLLFLFLFLSLVNKIYAKNQNDGVYLLIKIFTIILFLTISSLCPIINYIPLLKYIAYLLPTAGLFHTYLIHVYMFIIGVVVFFISIIITLILFKDNILKKRKEY